MAKKKKIEIEEVVNTPEVEEEKKAGFWNAGFWGGVAAVAGVSALVLHSIWKLEKEDEPPKPVNDVFKAPAQPVIPHVEPVEVEDKPEVKPVTKAVAPVEEPEEAPENEVVLPPYDENATFVGNYDSKVFHTKECGYGKKIAEGRKVSLYSKDEAVAAGYKPCGHCKP